ncbi:MAG TPA: hypothetical protein VFP25_00220 [Nitrososphaeraceae archaeon]|jgi:hypothetical protein|nr:hypothetical protein [Nitrososphaeraceae archaeon]HLN35996.1 hypothetical protein [Nitrososphaeraceae archaeon]
MNKRVESGSEDSENSEILTLPNIKYLVEGLETLLQTNLDGEKRSGVINLRDRLINITSSIINDFN